MIRALLTFALFASFAVNLLGTPATAQAGRPAPGGEHAASVDLPLLADAIRTVEGYRGQPGALGEEGPYQIRAITWRQHMPGIAFARAVHEPTARACALKHLAWLARNLEARGVPATAFNLAAAWNAGLDRYTTGRAPERAYAYALRVEAIYDGSFPEKEPIRFRLNP